MTNAALGSGKVGRWRYDTMADERRVLLSVLAMDMRACQIVAGWHRP